jgi:opacity protein-like surface antigen
MKYQNIHYYAIAFLFLVAIIPVNSLKAQSEFGVKGGINYFNIIRSGASSNLDLKWKDGLTTGIFYNTGKLWGPLGFQTELLYQMKGADIEIQNLTYGYSPYGEPSTNLTTEIPVSSCTSERLHYLNLPVLATISTTKFLDFYAGPELGYLIGMNTKRMETDNLNRFSFGASVGAKLKLCTNTSLDFRYSYDFTNYDDAGVSGYSDKYKNQGFAITIQQTLFRK